MIRHTVLSFVMVCCMSLFNTYAQAQTDTLTLYDLLKKVEAENPELKSKSTVIKSIKEKERQAEVLPNPMLEIESAETLIRLSEKVELGGKRQAKIGATKLNSHYAELLYDIQRQDLFLLAFERYISVISLGQQLNIAKEQERRYDTFLKMVKKQVQSGRLAAAEQTRAEIQLLRSTFEIEEIEHEYEESLSRLSMLYDKTGHSLPLTVELLPIPSHNLTELQEHDEDFLNRNKSYQLLRLSQAQVKQQVTIEKSLAFQDPTVSVGIRKTNGSESTSLVAGIGIPLSLFDRNKGNIEAASFRYDEWDDLLTAEKNEIMVSYEHAFHHAHLLQKEVDLLINMIVPKTKQVYEQVTNGYLQGTYTYLDVLNSQEEWVQSQKSLIDLLGTYWTTIAKLELILGHSLDHQLPDLFSQTKGDII